MQSIKDRYEIVMDKMHSACLRSSRSTEDVKLIVVTKKQPIEKVVEVIEAGAHRLGENFPEVIESRIGSLSGTPSLEWHMIGHIQSRKVKHLEHFSMIHSVDSVELLKRIEQKIAQPIPMLLEVNVSSETSKQGFELNDQSNFDLFCHLISEFCEEKRFNIVGLMCMPPLVSQAELNRPYFKKCREVMDYLREKKGYSQLIELSMGTSNDYQVAIEEGATFIRVGEMIMGPRTEV